MHTLTYIILIIIFENDDLDEIPNNEKKTENADKDENLPDIFQILLNADHNKNKNNENKNNEDIHVHNYEVNQTGCMSFNKIAKTRIHMENVELNEHDNEVICRIAGV